jgi:glycosyltransferase involved in cell wall biosynthesis
LREHGVDVRAVAARQYFEGEVPPDLPVELVPVPAEARRPALLRLRRPRGGLAEGPLGRRVAGLAGSVDVVHLEQAETAWCDAGLATPSVVHLHNRIRSDRGLGFPLSAQFRGTLEVSLSERAAIRRHRFLLASSPLVAAGLKAGAPRAHVVHAPLALDGTLYAAAPLDGPPIAGVIGTAGWPPTGEAMRRLLERVWPRVRRLVPEARLVVAGRGTESLTAEPPPGAEIMGEVPSAQRFLEQLSVLVFPLTAGSGVKVKVLEALATGIPIVTTTAGAEGIDGGEGVIVADDDDALAAATARLLDDGDERRLRGHAARAAFLRRYAPKPATEPLLELYGLMTQ